MDHLIWLFVVVVLLAGGLVSVSIWSRRRTWAKLLAILEVRPGRRLHPLRVLRSLAPKG